MPSFRTIEVSSEENNVAILELARPSKSNAVDLDMWDELPLALDYLDHRDDVRVVRSSKELWLHTVILDWSQMQDFMYV